MSLVGVGDLGVGTGDVVNGLDHLGDNLNQLVSDFVELLLEADLISIHLEFEGQECLLERIIGAVVTTDDFLGKRVVVVLLAESSEELNVLIDGVSRQLTSLVTHQSGNGVEEGLSLIAVEVLKLLSEDVDGAIFPLLV